MYINPQQNKILHALLAQTSMMQLKQELVWDFSNHRTSSSRELSTMEAQALIAYLKRLPKPPLFPPKGGDIQADACNRMRRKILAKAHKLRWEAPQLPEGGNAKIDMERVNAWCVKYGGFGKKLNQHTHDELVQLVTAFDRVYKHYISKVN